MKFIKTRDVKSPIRNVQENAGIDFYIPECNEIFVADLLKKNVGMLTELNAQYAQDNSINWINTTTGEIHIAPHSDVLIPSGIRSKFANNLALIANNKSGVATKKKLIFGASVIDASYQGEWHLHTISTSNSWQTIKCGEKIIQFIPHLISTDEIEILDMTPEEFYTEKTSRGDGGFGSTGLN